MAKLKIFNNLCKKTLVPLVSLYIIDNYIKYSYIRGLSLDNFIEGIIMVLSFVIISIFIYKFCGKGTYPHYAITHITPRPMLYHTKYLYGKYLT